MFEDIKENGWLTVKAEGFEGRASYITDVPLDILDALIRYQRNKETVPVCFDCEGSEFYLLILNDFSVYIIDERDVYAKIILISRDADDFTEKILSEIREKEEQFLDFLFIPYTKQEEEYNQYKNQYKEEMEKAVDLLTCIMQKKDVSARDYKG